MKRLAGLLLCVVVAWMAVPAAPAAAEAPPLVIVFDTSGSMDDEDGSGVVKLSAAKASMAQLVRAQAWQVPLGLWTYPGGTTTDGCEVGGWVPDLAPDERPDATAVDAQIRSLNADGETPTGPALLAVVESLQAKGMFAATIILVSDGESNCGPPPCEVAESIVRSGFDLTVAAVAFDIETGGTGELQCIADVTGGTFSSADDAAELINSLEQYQTKDLELQVEGPSTVRAGAIMTFDVTVSNPSSQPVAGASLLIAFDDRDLVPFVPAPHVRLPVIAAGESISRSWVVGTRSQLTGYTGWRILAGSPAGGSVSEVGAVTITDQRLAREDGGELFSDRGGTVVVLGDSYSAGEGAGDYLAEIPGTRCHRSPHAYGAVLGGSSTVIIACSGALSYDLLGQVRRSEQPNQLAALARVAVPDLVVLTIGGNDIGFSDIVKSCFLGECSADRSVYLNNINRRSAPWRTYEQIAQAINTPELVKARGGALAPVIVSPYPDPFWEPERGYCNSVNPLNSSFALIIKAFEWEGTTDLGFSPSEIRAGKDILHALNLKVEEGVRGASERGWPVYYADSVVGMSIGHSVCEAKDSHFVVLDPSSTVWRSLGDPWTNQKQELFHPNQEGHEAWTDALITWSQRVNIDADATVPNKPPSSLLAGIREALTIPIGQSTVRIDEELQRPAELGELQRSSTIHHVSGTGSVDITLEGLQPGTRVLISVESDPVTLGQVEVGGAGHAVGTVTLPQLSSGAHDLVLLGYNTSMQAVGLRIGVQVSTGLPLFIAIIAGVGAASLTALAVLRVLRRQATRQAEASMQQGRLGDSEAEGPDPGGNQVP